MKQTTLIGIIIALAFLLAVSGCGKDEPKEDVQEDVQMEDVAPPVEDVSDVPSGDAADEPEDIPLEQTDDSSDDVQDDTSSDVQDDTDAPQLDDSAESDDESGIEDVQESQNAQNYRVISLKDPKAYPEELFIEPGTTVEWRNVNDNLQHIIGWRGQTSMGVKPEPILQGESWSYTFNEPAEIKWFSTARPTIQGVITIEEPGEE